MTQTILATIRTNWEKYKLLEDLIKVYMGIPCIMFVYFGSLKLYQGV